MGFLNRFSKFGPVNSRSVERQFEVSPGDGAPLAACAMAQEKVYAVARKFLADVGEVVINRRLTDEGKREETAVLAAAALRGLDRVEEALLGKGRRRAVELEREIQKAAEGAAEDAVVRFLREREVRDCLRGMASGERLEALKLAVEHRDALVLGAFLGAPRVNPPLMEARTLAEAERVFCRAVAPEVAGELDKLRQALGLVEEDLAGLREDLKSYAEAPRTLAERVRTPEPAEEPVGAT